MTKSINLINKEIEEAVREEYLSQLASQARIDKLLSRYPVTPKHARVAVTENFKGKISTFTAYIKESGVRFHKGRILPAYKLYSENEDGSMSTRRAYVYPEYSIKPMPVIEDEVMA